MAASSMSALSDDDEYVEAIEKAVEKVIDEVTTLDMCALDEDLTELYLVLSSVAIGQVCAAMYNAEDKSDNQVIGKLSNRVIR
ncbi:MAG: hypothetical protein J6T94_02865 [Bacteroidaceae bacterium]|nr:hypothetical protein [Bacteroidaceae bacterium]